MEVPQNSSKEIVSFAQWVRDMLALMRADNVDRVALFESSVPEPVELVRDVMLRSFAQAMPASYKSVFMRNHPDVAARLSERYSVPEASILVNTGATTSITMIYSALLSPGDRILIETPGFDIFRNTARDMGLRADFYQRPAPSFGLCAEGILEALHPDTRMVVLTNLHNPSGLYVEEAVLAGLARALAARGVILVIDEVYRDYLEDAGPGLSPLEHDNVLRISSLTKVFGLSTLRCGWIFAPPGLMRRLRDYADRTDFSVSRLSHAVAAEVLASADVFDTWRRTIMQSSRPCAEQALGQMASAGLIRPVSTRTGCTCFAELIDIPDTAAFSEWLSARHGVLVVPGECFGSPGFIRIGYGLPEARLATGLARLAEGLGEYRAGGRRWQIA